MSEQFSHLSSEELRQELVKNGLLSLKFLILFKFKVFHVVQLEQQLVKFMRRDWRKNWRTTEKIKLILVEHRIGRFVDFFSFFKSFFGIECRKFFCKFAKCSSEKEFWGAGSWGLSI